MDATEFKSMIEEIGKDFHTYKKDNDTQLELLKKGIKDSQQVEKVDKIDKALTELVAKKDELVLKMKQLMAAQSTGDIEADPAEVEAKSLYHSFLRDGINCKGGSSGQGNEFFDKKYIPKIDPETGKPERKAMSVISDPDGGYMVTADMSGRMIKKIFETSDMRRVASVQSIATDALEGINDLGEASYGWVGETAARPATANSQIGKWRIPVHEMYAMPTVTQKLLDDANFNPEQWLAEKLADRFARAENDAFVNGTGVAKPRGFLTYPNGTTLGSTIEQKGSASNGEVTADTLIEFVGMLKTSYRARAQWGMHRLTLVKLHKIKDAENRYLWDPGLNGKMQQQFLGYQLNEFNDMPVPATDALAICFADWKEFYQIVDRIGIRVLRDPFTNKPYVQFYATKRTGGDVLNFEAGKLYKLGTVA